MVFHSHLLFFFGTHNFTLFSLALIFVILLLYVKCCPFINKQFGIDSFHDWEGHHRVFILILPTKAWDSLTPNVLVCIKNIKLEFQ